MKQSMSMNSSFSPFTTNDVQASVQYAGFWKRVGASLLDGIIFAIPLGIISGLIFGFNNNGGGSNLFEFIAGFLYKALMESSSNQGTLGKMIVGIKVTDLNGDRLSFGRATGRYFASILSGLMCGIGFMMAGWTSKKQALHDMIAGTLVVNK
jgi:uncharacterized RDD family membrane protein YckC